MDWFSWYANAMNEVFKFWDEPNQDQMSEEKKEQERIRPKEFRDRRKKQDEKMQEWDGMMARVRKANSYVDFGW